METLREETRQRQIDYSKMRSAINRAIVGQIKVWEGCSKCGYNDHPAALDFNHRDPATKFKGPAEMSTYKGSRIQAEIDKCDVLCANCHRIHTFARMGKDGA